MFTLPRTYTTAAINERFPEGDRPNDGATDCIGDGVNDQLADRFTERVRACQTDLELASVMDAVEDAFFSGTITVDAIELLATAAAERARRIHDGSRTITFHVQAEELTEDEFRCSCCGNEEWWGRGGIATCNVCHPNLTLAARVAA